MSTITLPNIRVSSDLTVGVVLKDGGVAIDWSTLSNIKAYLYADAQRAMAGRCSVAVDEEDSTRLVCSYRANKPQYIGVNRIVITCTYRGETKTFDKPALNFVRWTDDQAGQQITIDDPDVDVEIEVEDVSSSILEQAIAAALQAAADAEHAAHLIPNQVLLDCEQATAGANAAAEAANAAGITSVQVSVEDNEPGTPSAECSLANKVLSVIFHYLKGETGDAAGFGTITASFVEDGGDPSVLVTTSGPDTAKNIVFTLKNFKGDKGDKGDQGNTGSSVDYPYELVNNCTTDDATKGLSAAQGKALKDELSQLDLKVGNLSSAYQEENISAIALGYYDLTGATAPASPSSSTQTSSIELDAEEGASYKIYGYGGASARLYAFIDESRNILSVADADTHARETPDTVTAPSGAVKLIYQTYCYDPSIDKVEVYAPVSVSKVLETGETTKVWSAEIVTDLQADKYYVLNPSNTKITATGTAETGYYCKRLVVNPGEVYRITGKGYTNNKRMWGIAASDRTALRFSSASALDRRSYPEVVIIQPGEYYLYVNLYQYDSLTDKIEKLTATTTVTPGLVSRVQTLEGVVQAPIDALNSTSTTAPLAANQGRVLNEGLQKKVDSKLGKNLFDENATDITEGKYLSSDGSVLTNASKNISGYIPVDAETCYYLSADGGVGVNVNFRAFYDSSKNYISSQYQQDSSRAFTTPSGCAFVRFSYYASTKKIMFEKGNSRSMYEPYSIIGGYAPCLREGQVEYASFSDKLKNIVKCRFDSFRGNGTLASGESLTLATTYCKKDIAFVAHIDGTIESVVMGVGGTALTAYLGYYITITPTIITVNRMDTGTSPASANHGLTLTEHTTVVVETEIKDKASVADNDVVSVNITIYDNLGNSFTLNCDNYWGYGTPFFTNNNTVDSVDVSLSFFPKDEGKRVWVFGDSYWEFTYLQKRPPYWLFLNGHRNFLLCAKGGMSQGDQLTALNNLLSTGCPNYIFWMLGMNDGNDTVSGDDITVNGTAKANLDAFLSICETNGIVPILATTPTVPTRQHSGLADYVKSLGYRYVDVAKAVGCDTDGNWYTGLLGDDGVHPTVAGSKVIFSQILLDFPEIAGN